MLEPRGNRDSRWPARPRFASWSGGTALGAFALAFAIYVLGDTLLAIVGKGIYDRDTVVFSIVAYQFLALGVCACVAWLIVHRSREGLTALGFRYPGTLMLLRALLTLLPIFVGVALISAAFSALFPGFHLQGNAKQELPVGTHVNVVRAALILAWAAVEAPLVEETLFRGIVFQGIAQFASRRLNRHFSVFVGAVVSGVIFGLAHFEPHTLPILIFLGVALAYVFYYTRSIYASILVHGAVNAIATISVLHGA